MRRYTASRVATDSRSLLRFNGGWESMLQEVFHVSCSLQVSPFATPTASFAGNSLECFQLGASALSSIELMVDHLGSTKERANCAFFMRTDLSPSPGREFYESVHELVLGDAPFNMVVAHCCGMSVD